MRRLDGKGSCSSLLTNTLDRLRRCAVSTLTALRCAAFFHPQHLLVSAFLVTSRSLQVRYRFWLARILHVAPQYSLWLLFSRHYIPISVTCLLGITATLLFQFRFLWPFISPLAFCNTLSLLGTTHPSPPLVLALVFFALR